MLNKGMMTSETDQWNTPSWLIDIIHKEYGGIDLDPCTDESNPTNARIFYTKSIDGLHMDWGHSLFTFMNPPYGREIGKWTAKLETMGSREWLALLPARTDTKWFQRLMGISSDLLFIKGRLKFGDGKGSAPFPSVLVSNKEIHLHVPGFLATL